MQIKRRLRGVNSKLDAIEIGELMEKNGLKLLCIELDGELECDECGKYVSIFSLPHHAKYFTFEDYYEKHEEDYYRAALEVNNFEWENRGLSWTTIKVDFHTKHNVTLTLLTTDDEKTSWWEMTYTENLGRQKLFNRNYDLEEAQKLRDMQKNKIIEILNTWQEKRLQKKGRNFLKELEIEEAQEQKKKAEYEQQQKSAIRREIICVFKKQNKEYDLMDIFVKMPHISGTFTMFEKCLDELVDEGVIEFQIYEDKKIYAIAGYKKIRQKFENIEKEIDRLKDEKRTNELIVFENKKYIFGVGMKAKRNAKKHIRQLDTQLNDLQEQFANKEKEMEQLTNIRY